jgi:hypothetical protein
MLDYMWGHTHTHTQSKPRETYCNTFTYSWSVVTETFLLLSAFWMSHKFVFTAGQILLCEFLIFSSRDYLWWTMLLQCVLKVVVVVLGRRGGGEGESKKFFLIWIEGGEKTCLKVYQKQQLAVCSEKKKKWTKLFVMWTGNTY